MARPLRLKQHLMALKLKLKSWKGGWGTLIVVLAVFLFLGFSLRNDWETIRSFQWRLNWLDLVIMMLLHTIALGTMFLAWHGTMRQLVNEDQWRANFRAFSLSMLARRIPMPIWYVGSRVYLYRAQSVPASIVLTATAFEIALIAISGVLCYVLLLPWYTYAQNIPWWIFSALAGSLALAFLIRPGLLIDLINVVLRLLKRVTISAVVTRRNLFLWGFLYLATWFIDGLGLYYGVSAFLTTPPPPISVIGVSTISALVALITMALPSGFGLKEITMGALLGFWMPISAGVVLSFLYRLFQTIVEAIWALIGQRMI